MMNLDGNPISAAPQRTVFDPVHFSDLNRMALSPAHFKASVARAWESTRDMRVGSVVHHLVLGPHRTKPLLRFNGEKRVGNAWKNFEAEATCGGTVDADIVTDPEWEDAEPIAAAVLADPRAAELLKGGRREVSLRWVSGGIPCETDGIDLVGAGLLADLKRTSCTEPAGFMRHAIKHWWHAQLAFYEDAAQANGIDTSKGLFLIGVEPEEPYAVTCMQLSESVRAHGKKSLVLWLEKLRSCRENDFWPAYTQAIVQFELPPWMSDGDGDG